MPKAKTQVAEAEAVEVSRLEMLEAFSELVAERYGYWMARRLTQQEMSEAVKEEAKAYRETHKAITTAITTYIDEPTDELRATIKANQQTLNAQSKVLKEKKAPFMTKISPLSKATRYMDNVAIPDSLKEVGKPVQPRFSLSQWISTALEATKKKA